MENANMANNSAAQQSGGKKNFWIFIIILLALVALIYLAYGLTTKGLGESQDNFQAKTNITADKQSDGVPKTIYAYVGTVLNIGEDKITVMAPANGNYLEQDTELTVLVDKKTDFISLTVPETLGAVESGKQGKLFKRTDIKFSDLKTGDKVTVIAGENIKGKTEFKAIRVEVSVISNQ